MSYEMKNKSTLTPLVALVGYQEGGTGFDTHVYNPGDENLPANDAMWKEVA